MYYILEQKEMAQWARKKLNVNILSKHFRYACYVHFSSWYEARNGTPHTFILRNLQFNKSMDLHVGSVFTQPQHVYHIRNKTESNKTCLL